MVCKGDPALSRFEIRVSLLTKEDGLLLYGVLSCNSKGLLLQNWLNFQCVCDSQDDIEEAAEDSAILAQDLADILDRNPIIHLNSPLLLIYLNPSEFIRISIHPVYLNPKILPIVEFEFGTYLIQLFGHVLFAGSCTHSLKSFGQPNQPMWVVLPLD